MDQKNNEERFIFRVWLNEARRGFSLPYLIGFLVILPFLVYQIYYLSRDMVYGDGSIDNLLIQPRYAAFRVPESSMTIQYNAVNRLAGDFGQVYFPSKDLLHAEEAYNGATTLDPWHRASRYAPFINFVCAVTICQLPYGYAGIVHVVLQFALFSLGLAVALWELKVTKFLVPILFLLLVCIGLTPAGLSWFERGQFSLYVALSYLWLFLGLLFEKKHYIILSALFAFIKWTSFPFLFIFFCVYFLTAMDIKDFRRKLGFAVIFAIIIEIFFLIFAKASVRFLLVLIAQEMYSPLYGVSLAKLLPRGVVKLMPFVLILFGYINIRNGRKTLVELVPYFSGAVIISLTFSLIPFEYNIISVFGLAPFLIYWWNSQENDKHYRSILLVAPVLFLIFGSFSLEIFGTEENTIVFYILISLVCFLVPFLQERMEIKKAVSL
ncbi:MAG: hypothetical protein JNM55_04950 [Anaerolineales bacterium]|nr:hypothetical protein [Anaerolineales bacterium]